MEQEEIREMLIRASKILEENPEYLETTESGLLVPREDAPYDVKEYAKYKNKINQRIASYYAKQ